MSVKRTLPYTAWAIGSTSQDYAALILERIAGALIPPRTDPLYVREALALTRQWRKTLPPADRVPDIDDTDPRTLLRIAAYNIIDTDSHMCATMNMSRQAADSLRTAEAALRTWLKTYRQEQQ